jgi:hypothetical protein
MLKTSLLLRLAALLVIVNKTIAVKQNQTHAKVEGKSVFFLNIYSN